MFSNALLMLPDFGTILLGALLARRFAFQRAFWDGAERLVYYVLFPALLFNSILGAKFSLATDSLLLGAAVATLLSAAAMGFLARPLFRTEPALFASCVQTAYRYNSYVGLALAQSLFGARGVALLALILAVCIPLANLIAVTTLARHGKTHLGRELVTNPLILSTVSGMAAHLAGLELPAFASSFLTRMGAASLALGLLCIGAGLAFKTVKDDPRSLSWFSFVKLVATLLSAAALGFLARPLFKTESALFASCVQTAYRYNSYVGLALAQSLFGARGVALLALILAVCIPLANLIAVTTLARHVKTHLGRELATNPLILSTVSGMVAHLAGLELPAFVSSFLTRMGAASLALGLLCIGAGLAFKTVRDDPRTLSWFTFVKLVATPAVAVILVLAFGLRGLEAQVVLLFAALPTASSSYILAVRMGGLAAPVAVLITVQTLAAMVTLPLWLTFARF